MALLRRFRTKAFLPATLAVLQGFTAFAGTVKFSRDQLNARSSMQFVGRGNVLTTVPKGTEGEVLARFRLPSGNYGIKLKITKLGDDRTSLAVDEEIWVYYHEKNPAARRVELRDDRGEVVESAKDGDWAIALNSFRTEKPAEAKNEETAKKKPEECAGNCSGSANETGLVNPLPTGQVKDLERIADAGKKEEKKDKEAGNERVPVLDSTEEEIVTYISRYLKKTGRKSVDKTNRAIAKALVEACEEFDAPVEYALALMQVESEFKVRALSDAGAKGLMQLLTSTYRGIKISGKKGIYDIRTNVRAGVKMFGDLLRKYPGRLDYAAGAYNRGPTGFAEYLAGTCDKKWRNKRGQCFLPEETIGHMTKVTEAAKTYVAYVKTSRSSSLVARN